MSMPNAIENHLMLLLYNNTNIANIGDATGLRGSTAAGSFFIALHTAYPGETGDQTTSEIAYQNYIRVGVARSGAGWTVTNNQVVNAAVITFATAGVAGPADAKFWSAGVASAGASEIIHMGHLGLQPKPFNALASSDVLTCFGHGLAVNDEVVTYDIDELALAGGLTIGGLNFVKTVPDADSLTLSATQGGATLDITSNGPGRIAKVVKLAVSNGISPNFAAGALQALQY